MRLVEAADESWEGLLRGYGAWFVRPGWVEDLSRLIGYSILSCSASSFSFHLLRWLDYFPRHRLLPRTSAVHRHPPFSAHPYNYVTTRSHFHCHIFLWMSLYLSQKPACRLARYTCGCCRFSSLSVSISSVHLCRCCCSLLILTRCSVFSISPFLPDFVCRLLCLSVASSLFCFPCYLITVPPFFFTLLVCLFCSILLCLSCLSICIPYMLAIVGWNLSLKLAATIGAVQMS